MSGILAWFRRRKMLKQTGHLLHEARHLRRMREDIADREAIGALRDAERALARARADGPPDEIEGRADALGAAMDAFAPKRGNPRLREHIEILVVAVAVAMGFRTYFIQPFKIPTGSMQPTLHGITVQPQIGRQWHDYFPLNLVSLVLYGERYQEIRARATGLVDTRYEESDDALRFFVAGIPHEMPRNMTLRVQPGLSRVEKGQILASGRVRLGDHIFVNKLRYNFSRPVRGDIFVFSTKGIDYPRIRPDSFYIKRMAGLPGERLTLDPPHLVADGVRVTAPFPFERLVKGTAEGYHGYRWPHYDPRIRVALGRAGQGLQLSSSQYLPLGDNTLSSLDGRYFGGVERVNIVGPAFMVYWPFGPRWGLVR